MIDSTLVDPFYLHFMNANLFTVTPAAARGAVRDEFRKALPRYDDETLRAMLAGGWRSSKVAAWVIAARRRVELLPDVRRHLLADPGYAEHLCICLACLGGDAAAEALWSYLEGCADGSLQHGPTDETIVPGPALAALAMLEPEDPRAAERRETLWASFLARQVTDPVGVRQRFEKSRVEAQGLVPQAVAWLRGLQ
jgi:hypothetical protein